ncbi:hypothetical protein BDV12DRAFT_206490 [Aspergillus spectabilis]
MLSSIFAVTILLGSSFPLGVCREPLCNDNVTVNSTSSPFDRRDTTSYLYCWGECSPTSAQRLERREATPERDRTQNSKRQFVFPDNNNAMASFLVNRVTNWKRNNALPVFHYNLNPANSAQFALLGDEPVEMVLDGLCGCTAFAAVSQSAVFFAHFFEGQSFLSTDYSDPETAAVFEDRVIGFLETGDDLEGECIYILTPKLELSEAQPEGVETSGITGHGEGLNYEGQITRLRNYLQGVLSHIQPLIFEYEALDCRDDRGLAGHRAKALYQYDPEAYDEDPVMRGARLIFQAYDIPNPFDGDYYHSDEDRDLDDSPVQGPLAEEPLIFCGGQPNKTSHVRITIASGTELYALSLMECEPFLVGLTATSSHCTLASMKRSFARFWLEIQPCLAARTAICCLSTGMITLSSFSYCCGSLYIRCVESTLVPVSPNQSPDQSPDQSGVPTSSLPPSVTTTGWDFVLDGTTYTVGPSPTSIMDDGDTIILGPGGIIFGAETFWTPDSSSPSPTSIIVDDVSITLVPHTTQASTSTGIGPTTGATPIPTLPSSTPTFTGTTTPIHPESTVITWTATMGPSTIELTFTQTTLTQFPSLTTSSTLTIEIDGTTHHFLSTATTIPGFPPIPFPTAAPTPSPSSSSTVHSETFSSSTIPPFSYHSVITITTTIDAPDGLTVTTITGTTNPDGAVIPITTLSPEAAVRSAEAFLSELSSVSVAIVAFSSCPADAARAADTVETTQKDKSSGLSISGPSPWSLFGGSLSGIASSLATLASTISEIISSATSASGSSLSGPLNDLASLSNSLNNAIDEAIHSATITTQPSLPTSTSTVCESINAESVTTTCFSTTCGVETVCGGTPITSTAIMDHVCSISAPDDIGRATLYSYKELTMPTSSTTPTVTSTETSNEPVPTEMSTTTITTTEAHPPPPEPTTNPPPTTTAPPTDPTTTTSENPAPTWGGRCSTYEDCPRCREGYYRCCLSGCHGMLVPGSNTCGCVKDWEVVSPVCGCR